MKLAFKTLAAAAAFASLSAQAFPIADPGTEGFSVIVGSTGDVVATYQGNSASYSNDLYLGSTFIFNNHLTPVGTSVNLGSFTAGTELIFRLHVNNTGNDFYTGPASRNPDNHEHARVQDNWQPGETLVSFEDLFNGPFDYNDLSFSFTNTRSVSSIPEPETYALMLAGLGVIGALARRRKTA
jgi:hypothetical protein